MNIEKRNDIRSKTMSKHDKKTKLIFLGSLLASGLVVISLVFLIRTFLPSPISTIAMIVLYCLEVAFLPAVTMTILFPKSKKRFSDCDNRINDEER